jgi:hypothetical protein
MSLLLLLLLWSPVSDAKRSAAGAPPGVGAKAGALLLADLAAPSVGANHKDSYKVHFKKAAGVLLANTSVIREIFNNYGRVTHVYYLGNHGSVGFHSKDDCDNCLNAAKDIERNHGITVVPYVQTR